MCCWWGCPHRGTNTACHPWDMDIPRLRAALLTTNTEAGTLSSQGADRGHMRRADLKTTALSNKSRVGTPEGGRLPRSLAHRGTETRGVNPGRGHDYGFCNFPLPAFHFQEKGTRTWTHTHTGARTVLTAPEPSSFLADRGGLSRGQRGTSTLTGPPAQAPSPNTPHSSAGVGSQAGS